MIYLINLILKLDCSLMTAAYAFDVMTSGRLRGMTLKGLIFSTCCWPQSKLPWQFSYHENVAPDLCGSGTLQQRRSLLTSTAVWHAHANQVVKQAVNNQQSWIWKAGWKDRVHPQEISVDCEGYHELRMLCCWFWLFLIKILESTQAETTKIITRKVKNVEIETQFQPKPSSSKPKLLLCWVNTAVLSDTSTYKMQWHKNILHKASPYKYEEHGLKISDIFMKPKHIFFCGILVTPIWEGCSWDINFFFYLQSIWFRSLWHLSCLLMPCASLLPN